MRCPKCAHDFDGGKTILRRLRKLRAECVQCGVPLADRDQHHKHTLCFDCRKRKCELRVQRERRKRVPDTTNSGPATSNPQ